MSYSWEDLMEQFEKTEASKEVKKPKRKVFHLESIRSFKYAEWFGGIGAYTKALKNILPLAELYDYVELDDEAVASFNALNGTNFKPTDINDLDIENYPELDMIIAGWPCQDYSVSGKQLGLEGTRSSLILLTISKIKEMKNKPKHILLENVKGLLGKKHTEDLAYIKQLFEELGYQWDQVLLNSKYFGVPQSRERVYMLLTRNDLPKKTINHLVERNTVDKTFKDILDFSIPTKTFEATEKTGKIYIKNEMSHYGDNYFEKKGRRVFLEVDLDLINNPKQGEINKVATLGWFEDENFIPLPFAQKRFLLSIDGVSKTLRGGTKTTGGDPHYENGVFFKAIPFYQDQSFHSVEGQSPTLVANSPDFKAKIAYQGEKDIYHYRILTPLETWLLMGFTEDDYNKASQVSGKTALTKQAGNSIVVNVLEAIIRETREEAKNG